MKCPSCSDNLARVAYEGHAVFQCGNCFGYLLSPQREKAILATAGKESNELKEEFLREAREDTTVIIRCPRCRVKMKKERLKPPLEFSVDHCGACKLTWLDGGELALIQLARENTEAGKEAARFRKRWAEMSVEDRDEFEERLSNMPHGTGFGGADDDGTVGFDLGFFSWD